MKLRYKILLGVLGLVLLAPSAAVYWVATTESGLRFLLARLESVGTTRISTGSVTGTLAGGIQAGSLRVQHRISDVTATGIRTRIALWPLLLRRQFHVAEFSAERVSVVMSAALPRRDRAPRFLPQGLRIEIPEARIGEVRVTMKSGRELLFTSILGGASVQHKLIRVRSGELDWEDWHLQGQGRVRAARPLGLEGELDALWRPDGRPAWHAATQFDGNIGDLSYQSQIDEPFHASLAGSAVLQSDWNIAGHAVVQDFDLVPFGGGGALGIISGELDINVDRDGYTAKGSLTPPGLAAGAFNVDFSGIYRERRLDIFQTVIVHPPSGARATVRGTVDVEPEGPRLALGGQWTRFRWPLLAAEPAFTSAQGRYRLEGVEPWRLQGEGSVEAAGLPAMPAEVSGQLDSESFLVDAATLQLLGGNARFTGEARWNPGESWQIAGHMADLDPTQLREDLPGRLSFDFRANGAPFGDAGNVEFNVVRLGGELRQQKASGSGLFTRAAGSTGWRFSDVDITLGNTRVQLDGGLGETPDLDFTIKADDLSLFDPTARGRVEARGRYAGTGAAPLLVVSGSGSDFEWQGYRLARFDADLDIDLTREPGNASGSVTLEGFEAGGRTIGRARLDLSGTGAQQQATLALDAAPVRATIRAEGRARDGLWQGKLTSVSLQQEDGLSLHEEAPGTLAINLQQVELGQVCLRGAQELLCGNGRLLPDGTWNAVFSAESLLLSTFTAGLTQDIEYDGTINLRGALAGSSGSLPVGSVQGDLVQARVRQHLSNGREQTLSLGTGNFSAVATANSFWFEVGLDAGAAGGMQGRVDGERLAGDWRDYPIRGRLEARTDGLTLLDYYISEIDKATGQISASVQFDGTLGNPGLEGTLQLREASIDIYQINLALRELSLDARFDKETLELTGRSRVGDGIANFSGRGLSWREGGLYGDLHVDGERLLMVDVPEARIQASPDLDFKLAGRRIDVSGEVRLPYGRVLPADLTGAVLASSDEVLVGAPVVDPSQRWTLNSRINLILDGDVRIETFGLAARLGGALEVRSEASQESRGQGELTISEGKYAALGRLLDVDRGRLLFNNVPLGDPGIDLRAQKVFPDVTAGVNVRGSLRAPRLTFWSEPSLPQSQIASLILAGGSIESLRDSQASGAARNDLLAQGGAILLQRVGGQVGLDDVGIESDINNQASVVLGKYLSDRLYISYGISLAEAINTLKLRWTITDRWTIKTEAGQERSADIVYTLKK